MEAIKKAYREMAKAAHPDKNLDLDPEIANQRFHRIQEAWDLLSDERNKRAYDSRSKSQHQKPQNKKRNVKIMTERVKPSAQRRQQEQREKKRQKEEQRRNRDLARDAQETVQKFSNLEQLFEAGQMQARGTRTLAGFLKYIALQRTTIWHGLSHLAQECHDARLLAGT